MRIAIASGSFPRSADQAHTAPANFQLAKALANRGHHVLVLTFCQDDDPADQEGEVSVNGIRVVRKRANYERFRCFQGIPALSVFSWQAGRARDLFLWAKPLLASFNPHVLECPESYGLGFFWAAERTFPLVIRCHGPMSLLIRLGNVGIYSPADLELVEAMELSTIAAADGIMSVCDDLADRLSNATGRARCDFIERKGWQWQIDSSRERLHLLWGVAPVENRQGYWGARIGRCPLLAAWFQKKPQRYGDAEATQGNAVAHAPTAETPSQWRPRISSVPQRLCEWAANRR